MAGLLPVLAAAGLVIGIFTVLGQTDVQSIYLGDSRRDSHGWEYEIRTGPGMAKKVQPEYVGEYGYALPEEAYDAMKISRTMTEILENASLELSCFDYGVELFLDEKLLYSDFQKSERDEAGYLLLDRTDIRDGLRTVAIGLPEDYPGKELAIRYYFSGYASGQYPITPYLQNMDTLRAGSVVAVVDSVVFLIFWAVLLLCMSVFCMIAVAGGRFRWKLAVLAAAYGFFFVINAYWSALGYYSGLQGWIDRMLLKGQPMGVSQAELAVLTICGTILLLFEIDETKRKGERVKPLRFLLSAAAGYLVTAAQYSTELAGGIPRYLPAVITSMASGNVIPAVKLYNSLIIYTVTFLTIGQFVQWQLMEWRKRSLLVERSRFARENYELIMQVDEDSRKRRHEMKHHMDTLYSLLAAGGAQEAKEYIQSVMKESEQFSGMTYSQNMVVNSIVGLRLNRAKQQGIAVQCHIHVPDRLDMDDADLSAFLSNMLENSMEACLRMENEAGAYIRLEIRKRKRFLFIECENSMDSKESAEGQKRTVKGDEQNHGFGLEAMKAVAEKYAGILQIERKPGSFTVRTNLCLPR